MQIEYKALTRSSSCFLVVGKPVSVQRLPVSCAVARIELLCALTGTQSLVHCVSLYVCVFLLRSMPIPHRGVEKRHWQGSSLLHGTVNWSMVSMC